MIPTADDVATAIVTASRAMGCNPLNVVVEVGETQTVEMAQSISRARAYAAFALDKVCNDNGRFFIARPSIAAMVGVSKKSKDSYFAGIIFRKVRHQLSWWDDAVLHRVIAAVVSGRMEQMSGITPQLRGEPVPYKRGPLPPVKYKSPDPNEFAKVLADDADDGPVFDKGGLGGRKGYTPPARDSKQRMADDLAEAARNTAALPLPPED